MNKFRISLNNEKLLLYNRLSSLIIFILFVFFCYLVIFTELQYKRIISIITIVLLSLCYGLQLYFSNTKYKFNHQPYFLIILFGWISLANYWMAGITLVFDIFSILTKRKLEVLITQDQIQYPTVPIKRIYWNELNQLILKDGLLTIDFKSNKLIQQTIDKINTTVDEKEFNDFCKLQLNK